MAKENTREEQEKAQEIKNSQAQEVKNSQAQEVKQNTSAQVENKVSYSDDVMIIGEVAEEEIDLGALFNEEEDNVFENYDFKNYEVSGVFDGFRIAENGSGTTFSTYSIIENGSLEQHTIKLRKVLNEEQAKALLFKELKFIDIEAHIITKEVNGREAKTTYYSAEDVNVGKENKQANWKQNTSVDLTVSNVVNHKEFMHQGKKKQATEIQTRFRKEDATAMTIFTVNLIGKSISPKALIGKKVRLNQIEIAETAKGKVYFASSANYIK
jgi:hypothetical protein